MIGYVVDVKSVRNDGVIIKVFSTKTAFVDRYFKLNTYSIYRKLFHFKLLSIFILMFLLSIYFFLVDISFL